MSITEKYKDFESLISNEEIAVLADELSDEKKRINVFIRDHKAFIQKGIKAGILSSEKVKLYTLAG